MRTCLDEADSSKILSIRGDRAIIKVLVADTESYPMWFAGLHNVNKSISLSLFQNTSCKAPQHLINVYIMDSKKYNPITFAGSLSQT